MENRYYGTGKNIENDAGYTVKVGEPVFDDKVTANEYGVAYILVGGNYAIKNDTQYLATLEVNGESKMYRELWMSGNTENANEVALSDYTFTMDEGTIGGLTEDDVVIARFEPVEVYTSDAFRAAVGKVAPETPNELPAVGSSDKGKFLHTNESTGALEWAEGGSGGGVLVVHETQHVVETLVSGTLPNITGYAYSDDHGDGRIDFTVVGIGETISLDDVYVTIGTKTYSGQNDLAVQGTDTLRVNLKDEQIYPESAITGLTIVAVEAHIALDHTWQEIHDAMLSGGACVEFTEDDAEIIQACDNSDGTYVAATLSNVYTSTTADGYPTNDD